MKIRAFICTAIATAFLATIPASADSITYTASGFESGTIGTITFNLAAVTVTLTADTSGIGPSSINPSYLGNPGTATITIAGIGTATFTDSMFAISSDNSSFNGNPAALIYDATDGRVVLGAFSPAFLGYGLGTSIGPVSGATFASGCNDNPCNFNTSLGLLNWAGNAAQGPTATFEAQTSAVPEPSSLALLSPGLVAVLRIRKWR